MSSARFIGMLANVCPAHQRHAKYGTWVRSIPEAGDALALARPLT